MYLTPVSGGHCQFSRDQEARAIARSPSDDDHQSTTIHTRQRPPTSAIICLLDVVRTTTILGSTLPRVSRSREPSTLWHQPPTLRSSLYLVAHTRFPSRHSLLLSSPSSSFLPILHPFHHPFHGLVCDPVRWGHLLTRGGSPAVFRNPRGPDCL